MVYAVIILAIQSSIAVVVHTIEAGLKGRHGADRGEHEVRLLACGGVNDDIEFVGRRAFGEHIG